MLQRWRDRGSTPMSCVSGRCGWCSSRSVRSRMSPRIWASTRSRCGTGCGRRRPTSGRRRELLTSEEREELKRLRQGERRAAAGERDLEGRLRVFRAGARPDPAKVTALHRGAAGRASGSSRSAGCWACRSARYYARRSRKPSARALRDAELLAEIERRPQRLPARSTGSARPGRSCAAAASRSAATGSRG